MSKKKPTKKKGQGKRTPSPAAKREKPAKASKPPTPIREPKLPMKEPKVKQLPGPPQFKVKGVPGKDGDHGQVWGLKLVCLKGHAHKFKSIAGLLGERVRVTPQLSSAPTQDLLVLETRCKAPTDPGKPPSVILTLTGDAQSPRLLGQVVELEKLQGGLFDSKPDVPAEEPEPATV